MMCPGTNQFSLKVYSKRLHLNGKVLLPAGQKLNQKAPSKIEIYEMSEKEWLLTEEVNLNDFFSFTELILFQKHIPLKSEKSEIKLKASLYHCPKEGRGICVIDDYEGFISRSKNKISSEVQINLKGNNPK
jgi:hypothetical protein